MHYTVEINEWEHQGNMLVHKSLGHMIPSPFPLAILLHCPQRQRAKSSRLIASSKSECCRVKLPPNGLQLYEEVCVCACVCPKWLAALQRIVCAHNCMCVANMTKC